MRNAKAGARPAAAWLAVIFVCLTLLCFPFVSKASAVAKESVKVVGTLLDIDTRPDIDGLQYAATAVKDVPSGVETVVGLAGITQLPNLPAGALVKAEIVGPQFTDAFTISGMPNSLVELPLFRVAGTYRIFNVRLEDQAGNILLERDPKLPTIEIEVIDEILASQVTVRPLTLDEINDLGIVIDDDNFQVVNFSFVLTFGSDSVAVDLPVFIPGNAGDVSGDIPFRPPVFNNDAIFESFPVPNLSLQGFQLRPLEPRRG